MYAKAKSSVVPSDAQAREKLAMYVYEYLLHVGAGKAAHTFLQEIGWEKNIALGESPGFLHSWWCVFWDLYCASPERRDTCEHSSEAKAFHDYSGAAAPSPLNSMPPDGMPQPGMPPGYFPPGSAASPSPHHGQGIMRQPFMSPRYPPGGPRMQGPGGPQPMLQGIDHTRQAQMMSISRMGHPRGIPHGSINPYAVGSEQFQQPYPGMRMASGTIPGHGAISMSMHGRWPNPSGPPVPPTCGPPGTPMRSPQGPRPTHMHPGPHAHRFPHDPKNPDPLNSAEYAHMGKPMPHHPMPPFPMSNVQDNNLPPTSIPMSAGLAVSTPNLPPNLNGMNGSSDNAMMEGLKSSPSNNMPMNNLGGPGSSQPMGPPGGPGGTPHTPQDGEENSFNMVPSFPDEQNENAAILKIKESMQQEAKRFETKDSDGNGPSEFTGFMS
ncbi:single-stranded DNA-binding protein 4 isoform X2 [Ciona intestinalis]